MCAIVRLNIEVNLNSKLKLQKYHTRNGKAAFKLQVLAIQFVSLYHSILNAIKGKCSSSAYIRSNVECVSQTRDIKVN